MYCPDDRYWDSRCHEVLLKTKEDRLLDAEEFEVYTPPGVDTV